MLFGQKSGASKWADITKQEVGEAWSILLSRTRHSICGVSSGYKRFVDSGWSCWWLFFNFIGSESQLLVRWVAAGGNRRLVEFGIIIRYGFFYWSYFLAGCFAAIQIEIVIMSYFIMVGSSFCLLALWSYFPVWIIAFLMMAHDLMTWSEKPGRATKLRREVYRYRKDGYYLIFWLFCPAVVMCRREYAAMSILRQYRQMAFGVLFTHTVFTTLLIDV